MEAYLDNSATTRVFDEVTDLVVKLMREDYGNPSSMHTKGFEAEKYIKKSKEIFADIWKVTPGEIIFTSGGTESNNMALYGVASARGRQGKHIITTKVEHAAISAPCKYLESMGYEITYLDVDNNGIISLDELESAIRDDTILVSIMHVNNEIGSIMPIEEAGTIIKNKNPKCLFHVDDIQGFGKLSLYPKKMKIDMISVSGHKIHGPKGVGVLYVSKTANLEPLILGGGQQNGMRSGTENVPGIAGIGEAARIIYKDGNHVERLYELRDKLIKMLSTIDDVVINGSDDRRFIAPHIISLSVKDVRAEVLLHALEDKGVFVSAGSACSSNKPAVSKTLKAIGIDKSLLDSTVRLSLSVETKEEELVYAFETLSEILPVLRRYTRK